MNSLIELTVDECLSLLETRVVGRVGFMSPAGLQIYPVNYTLADTKIVFRTVPYGRLANNAPGAEVAFEVDSLDAGVHGGWSVLAVGRCRRLEDPGEVRWVRETSDPVPWAEGQRNLYFMLDWRDLTGRQINLEGRPALAPPLVSGDQR